MAVTINSETIQNNNVQITEDASGNLIITDPKTDGSFNIGPDGPFAEKFVSTLLTVGGGSLGETPLISNNDQYIKIDPVNGSDDNPGTETEPLKTIQEAANRCPTLLRNRYVIYLVPGVYDEDVEVRNVLCSGRGKGGDGGNPPNTNRHEDTPPKNNLEIRGSPDLETPSTWRDYQVGSLEMSGCLGAQAPTVMGVHFMRDSPYSEGQNSGPESDEWSAVSCHSGGCYQVRNCSFSGNVTTCIKSYGAMIEARHIDVEDGAYRVGFAKELGDLQLRFVTGGTVTEGVYPTTGGRIVVDDLDGLSATSMYQTGQGARIQHITEGWVMFHEGGTIRDLEGIDNGDGMSLSLLDNVTNITHNGVDIVRATSFGNRFQTEYKIRPGRYSTHPDSTSQGDMWYIMNGEGVTDGWYGFDGTNIVQFDTTPV